MTIGHVVFDQVVRRSHECVGIGDPRGKGGGADRDDDIAGRCDHLRVVERRNAEAHDHVRLPGFQSDPAVACDHPHLRHRHGIAEGAQAGHQPQRRKRQGRADRHDRIARARAFDAIADLGKTAGERCGERKAGFGRFDCAMAAVEQQLAQFGLQRGDLAADRGLGHAQFARSQRDAAMARGGLQREKRAERGDAFAEMGHGRIFALPAVK